MLNIEFRHLRTIRAIHQAGGLARAADMLNITQSALIDAFYTRATEAGFVPYVGPTALDRLNFNAGHLPD